MINQCLVVKKADVSNGMRHGVKNSPQKKSVCEKRGLIASLFYEVLGEISPKKLSGYE